MLQPLFLKYKDIFSSDKGEDLFSDFMSSSIVFFISRHSEFNMKRDFIAIIPWGVSINLSLIALEIVDSWRFNSFAISFKVKVCKKSFPLKKKFFCFTISWFKTLSRVIYLFSILLIRFIAVYILFLSDNEFVDLYELFIFILGIASSFNVTVNSSSTISILASGTT